MSEQSVHCKKLDKELPALGQPPFDGELGAEIQKNISKEGWALWHDDMMIKVINEYRLNLADADHYDVLIKQMRAFLNLDSSSEQPVLEVENPDRGK